MTKEEYLKLLHEDPMFKAALNIAKEDSEKAAAASLAEQFVLSFYGLIEDMRKEAEEDPDGFLKKIAEEVDQEKNKDGAKTRSSDK